VVTRTLIDSSLNPGMFLFFKPNYYLNGRLSEMQWWKSTQLSYLSKSKDTIIENDSSKGESRLVKFYLSKSLKVLFLK
jgi:hypothetical protein